MSSKLRKLKISPYRIHRANHINCEKCELCEQRNKVVLGSGRTPCDVLFVGEAPGASEDVIGRPFVGPAGHLLQKMITSSGLDNLKIAKTNLVGCIPKDSEGKKMGEPLPEHIKACEERLEEFIAICRPRSVVAVGKLAKKYVKCLDNNSYNIIHPAAILRMDISQKGLAIQRCVCTLKELYEELSEPKKSPKKILRPKKRL